MSAVPLRILIVLNGSIDVGYAGGDLHTVAIANRWAERHTVDFLLPRGSSCEIADLLGASIHVITEPAAPWRGGRVRLAALYALRALRGAIFVLRNRARWDVVVASSHFLFDLVPVLFSSRRRCRRVVYWHHDVGEIADRAVWVRVLVKASEAIAIVLLRWTKALVFTSSPFTQAILVEGGIAPLRVMVTRNSGSLARLSDRAADPDPLPLDIPSGARIVLFCGRLSKLKGTAELRHIAHEVKACADTILVVCGADGDDGQALRRDLDEYVKQGRVFFMGFVDELTKAGLFRRAQVVVTPSYEEGWGVTVGDGLAAGCWVVSYDLPAVRQAFPDGPRFVSVGDWRGFVEAVTNCLSLPRPPQREEGEGWNVIADRELEMITHG